MRESATTPEVPLEIKITLDCIRDYEVALIKGNGDTSVTREQFNKLRARFADARQFDDTCIAKLLNIPHFSERAPDDRDVLYDAILSHISKTTDGRIHITDKTGAVQTVILASNVHTAYKGIGFIPQGDRNYAIFFHTCDAEGNPTENLAYLPIKQFIEKSRVGSTQ
jgi:hypothetical protein